MKVAMYRGPATGLKNKLGHWLVCILTLSRYSHCELEIGGTCYSSSFRDGGVRSKVIDLTSGKWDVFPVQGDEKAALERFHADEGKAYDWPGMLRVCPLLRWLPRTDGKRFCSEEIARMLGQEDPETFSPQRLLDTVTNRTRWIFTSNLVPRGYDAITFWPLIVVRPGDRSNAALLDHEMVHYRRQAWITPFWLLAYWLSNSFRWREEVLGYRAQIKAGGITVYAAAAMLLTYKTGHTWEQALAALEATP